MKKKKSRQHKIQKVPHEEIEEKHRISYEEEPLIKEKSRYD